MTSQKTTTTTSTSQNATARSGSLSTISGTPRANSISESTSAGSINNNNTNTNRQPNDMSSLIEAGSRASRSTGGSSASSSFGGIPGGGGGSSDQTGGANGNASLNHIGLNYINSILGSGIVGIPYALHKAGFGFGLFLLISLAIVTDYSLSLLMKAASLAGVTSYQDLVHVAFGRPGFYLLTLLQFIYPFIAMISYNVIIGDTITKVFKWLFACKYSLK